MSLIGVWRERKEMSPGPSRPPRLWKLAFALLVVALILWRLSQFG
jgi:hypothetical protein